MGLVWREYGDAPSSATKLMLPAVAMCADAAIAAMQALRIFQIIGSMQQRLQFDNPSRISLSLA